MTNSEFLALARLLADGRYVPPRARAREFAEKAERLVDYIEEPRPPLLGNVPMDDDDFLTLTRDIADAAARGGMDPRDVDAYTHKARWLVATAQSFDALYDPPEAGPSEHGYPDR